MPKLKTMRKVRVEEIRRLIVTNDVALEEALLTVYECQTEREKNSKQTIEDNGVGFNGVDAKFLTKMAEWVLNDRTNPPGLRLSQERRLWTRNRMRKYAKQLERAGWFFVDPATAESSPLEAPETPQERVPSGRTAPRTTERFSSRTDALRAATDRIEIAYLYLEQHPEDEARVKRRIAVLEDWVDRLVLNAEYRDLRSLDFVRWAKYARPCPSCKGSCRREEGKCYRCRGKGFQTRVDMERNARYDERRAS